MKDPQNRKILRDIFLLIALWCMIAVFVCVAYQTNEQTKTNSIPANISSVINKSH